MPKPNSKQTPPGSGPGIFSTDLSALNKLYQAAKSLLESPSLSSQTALKQALEEVEKGFLAKDRSDPGRRGAGLEVLAGRAWASRGRSRG